jgi:hypothetical protein
MVGEQLAMFVAGLRPLQNSVAATPSSPETSDWLPISPTRPSDEASLPPYGRGLGLSAGNRPDWHPEFARWRQQVQASMAVFSRHRPAAKAV